MVYQLNKQSLKKKKKKDDKARNTVHECVVLINLTLWGSTKCPHTVKYLWYCHPCRVYQDHTRASFGPHEENSL